MPRTIKDENERRVAFSIRITNKNKDFITKHKNYSGLINDLISDFRKKELNKNATYSKSENIQ